MIKNYLKICLRFLIRNKLFSAINIIGLSIGMAATLLILLWVIDEFSFDLYHKNKQELYRVVSERDLSGEITINARTPNPLGPELVEKYPEIINFFRYQGVEKWTLKGDDHATLDEVLACADPSIFQMLDFKFIHGDRKTAFEDPYNMVITNSSANRFFGTSDVIGKTIILSDREIFTISAVIKDIPENSHIMFDCIVPISRFELYWEQDFKDWNSGMFYTYVQVSKKPNIEKLTQSINKNYSSELDIRNIKQIIFQNFKEIHLGSANMSQDLDNYNKGSEMQVYLFTLIAIGILLIACINFINLSTAGSINRLKEIGMRKLLGSRKQQLIYQFVGESILISFLAHIIAMFIIEFFITGFNELTNKQLSINYTNPVLITVILTMIIFTGIGAGLFPALYASRLYKFNVIGKGNSHRKPSKLNFRKILVIAQFIISSTLIICSLFIYKQIDFVNNKDLGYDHKNILTIGGYEFQRNFESRRSTMTQHPGIIKMSRSHSVSYLGEGSEEIQWEGKKPDSDYVIYHLGVGPYFIETYGIELLAGRNFYSNSWNDTSSFILNELAVKGMNLDNPIGTKISYNGQKGTIIGVIKDFHQKSLHESIKPLIMQLSYDVPMVSFKISEHNKGETIEYIREKWNELVGEHMPFNYNFLEDVIANSYNNDQKTATFIKYFTVLSIFIAAMGLLGLSLLSINQKTKEIGIRKVNGARPVNIINSMAKSYLILITIGFIISAPISYQFIQKWLQNFTYKINISHWIYLVVFTGLVILTSLIIAISTYRASNLNPADSLRYE